MFADGNYAIKVVATDSVGHFSTVTNNITKAAPPPDTTGPTLNGVTLSGAAIISGSVLTGSDLLRVAISDPSGVSKVEFLIDGVSFGIDTNGADGYSAYLDILNLADGAHTLTIRATDSLGNRSDSNLSITVAMAAPPTPVLTAPVNNLVTAVNTLNVIGTASPNVQVVAYLNAVVFGTPVVSDATGKFTLPVTLNTGINLIQVAASNRGGLSPLSPSKQVTLDDSIPVAPLGLSALSQPMGKIKLLWNRVMDAKVVGYDIYRSTTNFNAITEAVKINSTPIPVATATYDDVPVKDGNYFYRVVAVNNLATASAPSNIFSAVSDNTLPKATEIIYTPTGKTDPATGRIAAGRVDVTVQVTEVLSALPFLSLAPQGGTPIPVDLVKQSDTVYTGSFNIAPNTTTGVAYAVFSARDIVGNRGTEVVKGLSINIDAQGPQLMNIAVTPSAPIKNDAIAPATLAASFTLNEAPKSGVAPQISYTTSGNLSVLTPLTLTQTSPLVWTASFTLGPTVGQSAMERLSFNYSARDDLDNVSTTIMAPTNSFQVYQGTLPALGVPQNIVAIAQAAGKIKLSWGVIDQAVAYQIYRQGPTEAALTPFQRIDAAGLVNTEYVDATLADGLYRYSVASIRGANAQESLSAQSNVAEARADSVPPNPPQNLTLMLVGAGVQATWTAATGGADSYKLYRSGSTTISSSAGLTPILSGIKQLGAVDTKPSQAEHAYAATAVDAAGNESVLSNSSYLNFSLLPLSSITAIQADSTLPQVSWTHPNPSAIAGYDLYLGSAASGSKLNLTPLTAASYVDTGYASDERHYTVVAFDSNGAQVERALTLPKLGIEVISGTPILRNVMNRLQYKVTNLGSLVMSNAIVKAKIGIREVSSSAFSLAAGESKTIPVVVGGYADITNPSQLITTVESSPNVGDRAVIVRTSSVNVADGSLVLTIGPEKLTRGATGNVRFTLENTSDVEIELLTASNSGSAASSDIRYKLLDKDGNVLTAQPFKQALGNVITINTGQTVARIPAHASFTSDPMLLAIPSSAPDTVTVQLEIDNIRYHLGAPEAISVPGLSGRQQASLLQTPYYAEVASALPASSFGDQDVVITGRAIDRASLQPLGNVALKLYLNVNGFERRFDVFSDPTGNFNYHFKPTASDAGAYKVSVVHPDVVERPVQGQFVVNGVTVTPTSYKLSNVRNYPFTFKLNAKAATGTTATNVRAVYEAAAQPSGTLPTGITVTSGVPINLLSAQSGDIPVTIAGDNSAPASGSLMLRVYADEKGVQPVANIPVNYVFTDGKPSLYPSPSFVETGVAQGGNTLEQITLENRGFAEAQGVTATLVNPDGTAAPSWIYLAAGNIIGNLVVGEKRVLDISVVPPGTMADGIYTYMLRVASANAQGGDVPIYVSLTQAGIGNVLFKASDIYTGTLNASGQLIAGMSDARITLQNETVATITQTLTSDSFGEAYFTDIPTGRYKFRATAPNHQEVIGRLTVKPGITISQDVFLDYNLVTVEWTVTPINLADTYTITPLVTFVANVPAPVVLLEPLSVNLPLMKAGDVFMGEFTLTNYGLVRADNVVFTPPPADPYFRYEFMSTIPTSLEAKQRVAIPYRIVSLAPLDQPLATASGGGCYNYNTSVGVVTHYVCANGKESTTTSNATFYTVSNSSCPAGGGSVGGAGGGGGGSGGGGFGGGGSAPQPMPGASCVPPPCETCAANGTK